MQNTVLIAENHISISRKLFDEGMRAVENKSYKSEIKKLIFILTVLHLIVAVWLIRTGGSLVFLLGETVFLGAMLFWLIFMLPNTKHRNKYKAMSQGTSSIPERTIKFYQDHLSVTANSGKVTVISYDEISGWQETRNLYILNCNENTHLLVSKNGFSFGNFDIVKSAFPDKSVGSHDIYGGSYLHSSGETVMRQLKT